MLQDFSVLPDFLCHWCSKSDLHGVTRCSQDDWFTTPEKLVQKCLLAFWHVHTQAIQVAGALLGVRGPVSRPKMFLAHVDGPSGTKGTKHPEVLCSEIDSGYKSQFTQCQAVALILSDHAYNFCVSCKPHHSGFYPGHGLKQNNTTLNSSRQYPIPTESLRKRIA